MTVWWWGRLFWYGIFSGVIFLTAELTGEYRVAPWPTFSTTIQHDVHGHPWFAAVTLAVVMGLGVHWLFDQRLFPSLLFGLSVALSAHVLDNRWP